MNLLPHWVLTDKSPAFFDSDSKTVIEQTARVYGAMQQLITEYNSFVDSVNKHITDFETAAKKDYEIFTTAIRQDFQDFIDIVELKIKSQDKEISDAVDYMTSNLTESINEVLMDMRNSGGFSQEVMRVFSDMENEIAALTARMNTFTALDSGSTTGDAELLDARNDYTGKTWDNVGAHIRGVTSELSGEIAKKVNVTDLMYSHKYLSGSDFESGYIAISSGEISDNIRGIYNVGFVEAGTYVDSKDSDNISVAIYSYDKATGAFKSGKEKLDLPFTITSTESKFKLLFYWKDTGLYGNISEERANELKDYAIVITNEESPFLGNNETITLMQERISNMEEVNVAEYYFESDYLPNQVKAINENMFEVGANGETFVFITDVHWDLGNAKQSPKLINYIKEHTNIDCMICGGDIINEGSKENMQTVFLDFINEMKKIGIPFPIAYGNHDDNSNAGNPESEHFSNNMVMALEFKHILSHITFINPAYDRSFIFDKAETKTRFIFLDTRNNGALKYESITPFSNALNAVPDDYKVIVVAHWLFGSEALTNWGERITSTLDAYNSRGTYTNDQNNVTYNFADSKGKCVLILCGHTHKDMQMVTDGGIPLLNTTCDNYNRADESTERTNGTITEQAFDVVTVNYATDTVKSVRIGAGNNRSFSNGSWS